MADNTENQKTTSGITNSASKSLNTYQSGGVTYTNTGNMTSSLVFNNEYTLSNSSTNNVTLLDYDDAIVKRGSEINSSLTANENYSIYGAPQKWILDQLQQYNNCGVDSSLNVLAIAGMKAVTNQDTVETEFTKQAWDKGYCDDEYVYNVLDINDGGTLYEDRYNILKDNGMDSESYNGYYPTANRWYDDIFVNSAEYADYEKYYDEYLENYEKAMEALEGGDLSGAEYYFNKATDSYLNRQKVISNSWKAYTIEIGQAFSIDGIVEAVKSGKGFIAAGDAAYLWYSTEAQIKKAHYDNYGYLGHAVSIVGVVCDKNDSAVGFYIQDTGYGGDVSFITTEKLIAFITSGGTDYWNFATQMNVTKEEIRSYMFFNSR